MLIRNTEEKDYRTIEEMIKKAFWNVYVPGCTEHYFAHQIRKKEDYISKLDYVLEEDGKIIGNIIYVKAKLISEDGIQKDILSFGPFAIHPDYQRKGYGKKLLDFSINEAKKLGYDTIVIFGNPENYACYGFKNCKRYNIYLEKDVYPVSLMVKALNEEALLKKSWKYIESPAHQYDENGFEEFDSTFEKMKKEHSYKQELFYIYSRSNVVR